MIFRPKHAEDIIYVYVANPIFECVSDLFVKQISKWVPWYCFCVCVSSCSVDNKIPHCCFSLDKMKNENLNQKKKMHHAQQFLNVLLETYLFFGCYMHLQLLVYIVCYNCNFLSFLV